MECGTTPYDVAILLGMLKVGQLHLGIQIGVLDIWPAFFKCGCEVVWEKFGRCAESLARSDPAGSF